MLLYFYYFLTLQSALYFFAFTPEVDSDSKLKVSNKKQSKHKISEAYRSGQTALGRSLCQGGATTHLHRRSSLPARPHSAGRRVREEPRHTFTGGQIPACQTALGRSPCQGGAATHIHRRSSLPARPHSACRRVREEPQHRYTCGQSCVQITLINILQAHLS